MKITMVGEFAKLLIFSMSEDNSFVQLGKLYKYLRNNRRYYEQI